jgi:ABC-type sugar transport system ATPase subunit
MAMVSEAGGLTKRFGGTQALIGVDVSAESGQVLALPRAEL